MKRENRAFTLTELLIALGVIAILCAILLPIIFNLMPNQNTIMAKRAYYTVQSVISELLNDTGCYPDKTSAVINARVGFDDGFGSPNCTKWDEAFINGGDANTKFRTLFRDKLGLDGSGTTFTTPDGMDWVFNGVNFVANGTDGGEAYLLVDVNGKGEPNCSNNVSYSGIFGTGNDANCQGRQSGFDRFRMKIKGDGRVTIDSGDLWAQEAVKVDKNITE